MLKKIVLSVAFILIIAVAIAYLLPRHVVVERTTSIDATPETIFPHVADLSATSAWSPWYDDDPDVALTYEGEPMTVGSKMMWSSDVDTVGSGSQEIIALSANESVRTSLDFGAEGTAEAEFRLSPDGDRTNVVWAFEMDTGYNPITRYFGLLMDGWLGPYYEVGLARLKHIVESS